MVNNVNFKDMKTRIIVLAILLIIVGIACERITDDPAVVEPTYIVNITCDTNMGTVSPFGEIKDVKKDQKIELTIIPKPGFKGESIIVDGVKSPLTSNTYSLINGAKNSNVEVIFEKTLSWYIILSPWTNDSVMLHPSNDGKNGPWSNYASFDNHVVTFLPNGNFNFYSERVSFREGKWSIDETTNPASLNWGGGIWQIEKLNEVSLVIANYNVPCIGCYDPDAIGALRLKYSHH